MYIGEACSTVLMAHAYQKKKKRFGGHCPIQSIDRDNPSQGGVGEPKFLNYEMKSCCMFP